MTKEEFKESIQLLFDEAGVLKTNSGKLEADSISYIKMISAIEDEYDIQLPDNFLSFNSLQDEEKFIDLIYDFIDQK